MFDRTDEDIAAGIIRLHLGGQDYILPTLPWQASDEWQATLQTTLTNLSGRDFDNVDGALRILSGAMDDLVDLIAAYDREHKLGRDAADLKGRYDRAQLYEVFKAIARHEFPFMRDAEGAVTTLMPFLRPLLIGAATNVLSRQASTSNGRSRTGDSTLVASALGLTDSSSVSSGEPDKSA